MKMNKANSSRNQYSFFVLHSMDKQEVPTENCLMLCIKDTERMSVNMNEQGKIIVNEANFISNKAIHFMNKANA